MGGQGDDRYGGKLGRHLGGADRCGGFAPVHAGHGNVHEDEVGPQATPFSDRLMAIAGKPEVDVEIGDHLAEDKLVGPVVLDGEDAHRAPAPGLLRPAATLRQGRIGQRFQKAEKRAPQHRLRDEMHARQVGQGGTFRRRQRDRRGDTAFPQGAHETLSVQTRRLLGEDEVDGTCAGGGQSLLPAAAGGDGKAESLNLALQDDPADLRFGDDKDPLQTDRALRRDAGGDRLCGGQDDAEAETRPLPRLAFHPHGAAHQIDKLARDGETKPGALELTVRFAFDLAELPEDRIEMLRRDADPAILDADMQLEPALAAFDPDDAGKDVTGLGELDRIAEKIGEDLPHPAPVADEAGRQEEVEIGEDRDALFLRRGLQQQDHLMQAAFKIERLGVKLQPLRLDLGIVEHVVDDGQKRLARTADRLGAKPLFIGQRGFAKKLRHADDAVHRCPYLVAHVGEEGGFRPARRLGLFARLAQLGLARDGLCDIAGKADKVAKGAATVHQSKVPAVAKMDHPWFDLIPDDARDHRLVPGLPYLRRGAGEGALGEPGHDVGIGDLRQRHLLLPDHRKIDPVGCNQPLPLVEKREAVADGFQRLPQAALGGAGGGIGPFKLAQHLRGLIAERLGLGPGGFQPLALFDHLFGQSAGVAGKLDIGREKLTLLLFQKPFSGEPAAAFPGEPLDVTQPCLRPVHPALCANVNRRMSVPCEGKLNSRLACESGA